MNTVLICAALAAMLLLVSSATAHEWYPIECCSDNDCAPIPLLETPREGGGGFTLLDGRFIPYRDLRNSPDAQWHLCEQKWPADNVAARKILCTYAPIGGT